MNDNSDVSEEVAAGEHIRVRFDAKLCIHSRFCVLQAPAVFKANTPSPWIFPDAAPANKLAAVARNCPSGAISYESDDAALMESDPEVNTLRLRENGPYALNARIVMEGRAAVQRRTLCRCGASRNKPLCDGSHIEAKFRASGEPPAQELRALPRRDGAVEVIPVRDGPLELRGAVEFVSGTGRSLGNSVHCLLCRCGGSASKPFCDGTHASNGFTDRAGVEPLEPPPPSVPVPTLTEWAGGRDKLRALTEAFYRRVSQEPLLAPLFAQMERRHPQQVADFLAEVFGGPPLYSTTGGTHIGMIVKHLGRHISEEQRTRWVALMIETASEVGLPNDAAFRDAFTAYLEWGSKLAVINSAPGIEAPQGHWPMPVWGWGAARGPVLEEP
jgi:CDGSH-type Zn-finger protein/truncated hemoglobin YjbI/uncharacterized Fe-S cluster protein YjdI